MENFSDINLMDSYSAISMDSVNESLLPLETSCDVIIRVTDPDFYGYSKTHLVVTTIILPIMLIIGLLNNIAFIHVVIRVKCMKSITNACLINLAVADIIFLTGAIGDKIWGYNHSPIWTDNSHLGLSGCIFLYFFLNSCYFVSLITITLITFERFYAVCRPEKAMRGFATAKKIRGLLMGSWAVAALLSAILIPATSKILTICAFWPDQELYNSFPGQFQRCTPVLQWTINFVEITRAVPFFIAFFINVFLSYRIVKGLNQAVKRAKILGKRDRNIRSRNQVARMLIVNGLVFFICLAPFETISVMKDFQILDSTTVRNLLDLFFPQMLVYLNSLINPLIYIGMSTKYRKAFIKGLLQPRCRKK